MKLKLRGRKKIQGSIEISGAKNSAVAVIPAAILCDGFVTLRNIPDISDVRILINILNVIGYHTTFSNNILRIEKRKILTTSLKIEEMRQLRGSYYFYGALVGKFRKISAYLPGGCALGARPINYHLNAFEQLKANYKIVGNEITIKTRGLKGANIVLEYPSVGATINTMIASSKAKGTTIISNAATEPEVVDVGEFLNSMGAKITGLGTSTITVVGVKKFHSTDYTIINDRIEAGSFLILGASFLGKGLTIKNVNPLHLDSLIKVLDDIGVNLTITDDSITVVRSNELKPVDITTGPYPNFPTDLAQPLTALLTTINGQSSITEKIFSSRFSHVGELIKMGADITLNENNYLINGGKKLKSTIIHADDLRGAFACLIGGLLGNGITTIENIDVLFRGYEKPLEKLKQLGINFFLED